ncbi:hypothetical protein NW757_002833 [Fusarium falciforme]|nr:hypothetical protein NW757_002833 [Fusarium falciforme]
MPTQPTTNKSSSVPPSRPRKKRHTVLSRHEPSRSDEIDQRPSGTASTFFSPFKVLRILFCTPTCPPESSSNLLQPCYRQASVRPAVLPPHVRQGVDVLGCLVALEAA